MTIRNQRILITGSSGFIGGRLFAAFQHAGWDTVGLGRRALDVPGYFVHDLGQPLTAVFNCDFDVVVHAAAKSSPWGRRREFERANVDATRHVVDFCAQHGRPRLVFISSPSVYYKPEHQLNITEETPMPARAVNDYAATKRRAEELVQQYPGDWVILRPRAVFGPGDTVLMPRILRAARAGRLPLLAADEPVYCDLIYIDNVVDYVMRAACDPAVKGSFNLTNNEPVALLEFLLETFARLDIPAPKRRFSVRSAHRIATLMEWWHRAFRPDVEPPLTRFAVHVFAWSKTFDVSKMIETMGRPRVSLRDGVERFVAWVKDSGESSS